MTKLKSILSPLVPSGLWKRLRLRQILSQHKKTASICEQLVDTLVEEDHISIAPKMALGTEKIIWQYWAQGYDDVPEIVRKCLESVEEHSDGWKVIRLSDKNLEEYIELPDYVRKKRSIYSRAFFSDLLRCILLSTYGGIWLDATIMLSSSIPTDYLSGDFFLFQRDPDEQHKKYWESTFAYYFGWAEGFRVNMLSSFFYARKKSGIINDLSALMLKWWRLNDSLPDYFFFQILFDVLIKGKYRDKNCRMENDTLPHYLQQSMNDPRFNLMSREDILRTIPVHKLTYKK